MACTWTHTHCIAGEGDEEESIHVAQKGQPEQKEGGKGGESKNKKKRKDAAGGDDEENGMEEETDQAEAALERMLFGTQDIGSLFRGGPVRVDTGGDDADEDGEYGICLSSLRALISVSDIRMSTSTFDPSSRRAGAKACMA